MERVIKTKPGFAAYCILGRSREIASIQKNIDSISAKLNHDLEEIKKANLELETVAKKALLLRARSGHELGHLAAEFDSLLEVSDVERVEMIRGGIRVFTKPIRWFGGTHPLQIDLAINSSRPQFKPIGSSSSHALGCLNGNGHDSEMSKLLHEARLFEAAVLALELIKFAHRGGGN